MPPSTTTVTNTNPSHHQQQEKPKTAILIALTIATVNESLGANMLLPFVGNLISKITGNPLEESGTFSGIVVMCFHLGQFSTGTSWGRLGDNIGRRPVIFAGLLASMTTQLLFGLSNSIPVLCLIRLLQGIGNSNMSVIKTCVAEISTKETEAFAFSLLTFSWGIGTLAGQAISGLAYDPVNAWNLWPDIGEGQRGSLTFMIKEFLLNYPALAPCVAAALYGLISLIILSCYLQETNKRVGGKDAKPHSPFCCVFCTCCCRRSSPSTLEDHERLPTSEEEEKEDDNVILVERNEEDVNDEENAEVGQEMSETRTNNNSEENNNSKNNTNNDDDDDEIIASPNSPHTRLTSLPSSASKDSLVSNASSNNVFDDEVLPQEADLDFGDNMSILDAFKLPRLRTTLVCYMFLASHDIAFVECFPLLAILSTKIGGFALSVKQLGLINSCIGISQISANFFYPLCYSSYFKFGVKLYPISAAVTSIFSFGNPLLTIMAATLSISIFFPATAVILMIRQLMISFQYTSISIMMKSSAPKKYLGFAMSINQTAASFCRLITPVIAAPFFAFTAQNEFPLPRPFNVSMVFLICGVLAASGAIFSAKAMGMSLFGGCCCCFFGSDSNNNKAGASRLPTSDDLDLVDEDISNADNNGSKSVVVENDDDHDDQKANHVSPSPNHKNNINVDPVIIHHEENPFTAALKKNEEMLSHNKSESRNETVKWKVDEEDENDDDSTNEPRQTSSSVPQESVLMPWEEEGEDSK